MYECRLKSVHIFLFAHKRRFICACLWQYAALLTYSYNTSIEYIWLNISPLFCPSDLEIGVQRLDTFLSAADGVLGTELHLENGICCLRNKLEWIMVSIRSAIDFVIFKKDIPIMYSIRSFWRCWDSCNIAGTIVNCYWQVAFHSLICFLWKFTMWIKATEMCHCVKLNSCNFYIILSNLTSLWKFYKSGH